MTIEFTETDLKLETYQCHYQWPPMPMGLIRFYCTIFIDEGVDEMTFIKLTENQILRMRKDMTMKVQTELMAKQRLLRKVGERYSY